MNFNRHLLKKRLKLFFKIESVADLNAVRGFISALGIKKQNVAIQIGSEITEKNVKKIFRGCAFTRVRPLPKNWIPVRFDTEGPVRLASDGGLVVNYVPYKYFVPVKPSKNERIRLREAMRVEKGRKVILVSCSSRDEVSAVVEAWKRLEFSEKPLLIIGMRKQDFSLAGFLTGKGYKTHDRRSPRQTLSRFGKSDVVILNTMGELFEFTRAADLAIVGHDRNIFEPALLGVPVLYFERPLKLNGDEKKLARVFRLFWRKNLVAKELADKFNAAAPIKQAFFYGQIRATLRKPAAMIQGGRRAVRVFRRRVIPAARRLTVLELAKAVENARGSPR